MLKQVSKDSILDIKDILEEYSLDIQEGIFEAAENVAKKGASELRNASPKRTGKYRSGWRVQKNKGKSYVDCTIHNSKAWQLTHLLERPHAIRNKYGTWGTSKPQVHIKPVEERCVREYEKEVENVIKNGG